MQLRACIPHIRAHPAQTTHVNPKTRAGLRAALFPTGEHICPCSGRTSPSNLRRANCSPRLCRKFPDASNLLPHTSVCHSLLGFSCSTQGRRVPANTSYKLVCFSSKYLSVIFLTLWVCFGFLVGSSRNHDFLLMAMCPPRLGNSNAYEVCSAAICSPWCQLQHLQRPPICALGLIF